MLRFLTYELTEHEISLETALANKKVNSKFQIICCFTYLVTQKPHFRAYFINNLSTGETLKAENLCSYF